MEKEKTDLGLADREAIARVEALFVKCHDVWWRTPGSGAWPFAGDGPWHLMQRSADQGDYGGEGKDGVSSTAAPRTALRVEEVALRDRVTPWLQLLDDPADRRLVHLVSLAKWRGAAAIPWTDIARRMEWKRSAKALPYRYRKALALIWCKVNGLPVNRVRTMAKQDVSIW